MMRSIISPLFHTEEARDKANRWFVLFPVIWISWACTRALFSPHSTAREFAAVAVLVLYVGALGVIFLREKDEESLAALFAWCLLGYVTAGGPIMSAE